MIEIGIRPQQDSDEVLPTCGRQIADLTEQGRRIQSPYMRPYLDNHCTTSRGVHPRASRFGATCQGASRKKPRPPKPPRLRQCLLFPGPLPQDLPRLARESATGAKRQLCGTRYRLERDVTSIDKRKVPVVRLPGR